MTFNDISHRFMRRDIAIQIDDESKINNFTQLVCGMGITEPKKYDVGDILLKSFDGPQAIICKPVMCKMLHIEITKLSEIEIKQKANTNIRLNGLYLSDDYDAYYMGNEFPVDEDTYRWGTNDWIDDFGDLG